MLAKVTIIGRPNVGKSSLFNALTGHKIAIIADEAGTTRDISEFEYTDREHDLTYILADSGGLDFGNEDDEVAQDIIERTKKAIEESDLLLWVVEYDRYTELDDMIYKALKKQKAENFLILANKADNEKKVMESYSLAGKGELDFIPISCSHSKGLEEIRKFVAKYLTSKGLNYRIEEDDDKSLKLAFVGRPNVGKSSIVNTIVGHDRVMVKDMAGTTRDSIDTKFKFHPSSDNEEETVDFTLIDTAGIRRLSKVGTRNIENWSVMRTERAIKRADIIAVIIDGFEGIVQQDLAIISDVLEQHK